MSQKFIPLSVPNLKGRELQYITQAVETEWVSTAGPYIVEFENQIASYVGSKGAVSCMNGTAGLHIALRLAEVVPGDMVIVPTLTFIAAVNPVKYMGADPIFMDCDDSLTMDMTKLELFLMNECHLSGENLIHIASQRVIKALIVVHVFGNMADMEKLMALSKRYSFKVIEDATEAIGTYYTEGALKGRHAGTIGDIGVYSFNGNKIITTGGGGMIVSNNQELLIRAKHLTTQAKSDELNYIHDEIGYNYRMTNLQAAMGIAQLEQLESFIEIKHEIYNQYLEGISNMSGVELLPFKEGIRSNMWFYSLYCKDEAKLKRDELIKMLGEYKIQTRPIWGLIHEQRPYQGSVIYQIEKANDYLNRVVNLPCSTNISKDDVDYVIRCLKRLLND